MMKGLARWIDESRTRWRPFNNEFLSSFVGRRSVIKYCNLTNYLFYLD